MSCLELDGTESETIALISKKREEDSLFYTKRINCLVGILVQKITGCINSNDEKVIN